METYGAERERMNVTQKMDTRFKLEFCISPDELQDNFLKRLALIKHALRKYFAITRRAATLVNIAVSTGDLQVDSGDDDARFFEGKVLVEIQFLECQEDKLRKNSLKDQAASIINEILNAKQLSFQQRLEAAVEEETRRHEEGK